MKLRLLPLLAAALLTSAAAYAQIPTSGLIARWKFDNNYNDVTGNGHNGTGHSTSFVAGKKGTPNTACYLTGSNSYVGAKYMSDLNLSAYTIIAIMKPTAFYSGNCQNNFLFSRGADYTNGNYTMHFTDNAYNDCSIQDTNMNVLASNAEFITIDGTDWQHNTPHIHTGSWYTVAVSFDGSDFAGYIDGALKATIPKTNAGTISSSTDSIWIGGNYGNTSYPYWFTGYIDDMILYNRALTAAEIALLGTNYNDSTTDVNTIAGNIEASIYPNPNNGNFHLKGFIPQNGNVQLQILNTVGQSVYTKEIAVSNNSINEQISLNGLSAGVYYARLQTTAGTKIMRITIQ